jgi:hypothetical protein
MRRHSRVAFLLMFFLLLLAAVVGINLVAITREKAEAVAARQVAENNFRLYLKEQQVSRELGEDLDEAVLYTVKSRDFVNAPSMIQVLETGLEENIDAESRENLLIQKGTLHFVLQEFEAANACFAAADTSKRAGRLSDLSSKYAIIKPVDNQRLSDQQLADLFNEAKPANRIILYYMYYHHMRRRPASATPKEYLPLANAVLDSINAGRPSIKYPLKLTKTKQGNHLDLSRSSYTRYSFNIIGVYRRNVLGPLKLKSLDISHTQLDGPTELRGLKLEELRMVGTEVTWNKQLLKHLESLKLKRLVLNTDDCPGEMLAELRKTITVVDAKK